MNAPITIKVSGARGPAGPTGPGLNNRGQWVSGDSYGSNDYVFATNGGGETEMYFALGEPGATFVSTVEPKDDPDHWAGVTSSANITVVGKTSLLSGTSLMGLSYDSGTGELENTAQDGREVWVHDFYSDTITTDVAAIEEALLWAAFEGTTGSSITLKFKDRHGKGPNGVYVIDSLVDIAQIHYAYMIASRVTLDFGSAIIRYTSTQGGFSYGEPPYLPSGNLAANNRYFIVRGGTHQYAVLGIPFLFKWDFQYSPSRLMGTGYAENMRIVGQTDNASLCFLRAPFLLKNTWNWSAENVHYCGPPSQPPLANTYFIEQTGVCIVTEIDKCETSYTAEIVKYGYATQTGLNGTFTAGTYARGKILSQGAARGYFGRNDGGYGYTYSLFDVTGTFTTGAADVLDSNGNVIGSFNITATGVYYQPSEAITFGGGSNCIQCNYFINWSPPDGNTHMLDIQLTDGHVACYNSVIKASGIDNLMVTGFNAQPYPSASATTNSVMFDITNGTGIVIEACTSTTNDGHEAGTKDYRYARLRSVNGGSICGNTFTYFDIPIDTDNTVKDFVIAHNSNVANSCGNFLNTGLRFKGGTARGIRFYGNGSMGAGLDLDDPNTYTWAPVCTSGSGAIGAYTVPDSRYNVSNGMFHFHLKIVVSDRGTASGNLLVSFPALTNTPGGNLLSGDFFVPASINKNAMVAAYFDHTSQKLAIAGDYQEDAFSLSSTPGNFTYWVSGSVPVSVT